MSKVLVTGGAGYIGSTLVRYLLDEGYSITVLDRFHFGKETLPANSNLVLEKGDIRTASPDIIRGHDAVIDLAAISNDPAGDLNESTTISINHLGRFRMASLAKEVGISRYILPSSASVYGFSPDVLDETSPVNPLTVYGEANLNAEKDILALNDDAFTVVVLRQSTVFGSSMRMRFDLAINGMVKGYLEKGVFPILKDGKQWRPFIHVKDTSRAMELCLRAPSADISGQIFNVGSDSNNYRIYDLASHIADSLGLPFNYEWYGAPDHRSYRLNFNKINTLLGFDCLYDAGFGAKEIASFIEKHESICSHENTITLNWYKKLLSEGVVI